MPGLQHYRVYKLKFILAMQDPDMEQPRYHTVIFVETNADGPGSGIKHHVIGDIVQGMTYESKPEQDLTTTEDFHSKEFIGHTEASSYPHSWDEILKDVPPPPKQKAFDIKTLKTEPVKSWNPLSFYEPGEPRRRLVKCTEWVEQQAIPILQSVGLVDESRISHSDSAKSI